MKTSYSQETGIKTWGLTKWYEKTSYVLGLIFLVYMGICFSIGVVVGVLDAIK